MHSKFLLTALVVLTAPTLFAQDYEIRLSRPFEPGYEQKISFNAKQSQVVTSTVNGKVKQDEKENLTVQFDGTEKILEVDSKGRETKVVLTVDKFTQTAGDATSDVEPKGAVITCSMADGKPSYEVDGKAVDAAAAEALDLVVQLKHTEATDDDMFGTKEHKKKGDSWNVNASVAKSDFEAQLPSMELGDLSGKTTLDDVAGDAMKISAHMTGSLKPPLPSNFTVDDSALVADVKGTFPTDVTKQETYDSTTLTFSFSAHADGPGGKAVVKATLSQSTSETMTPVK